MCGPVPNSYNPPIEPNDSAHVWREAARASCFVSRQTAGYLGSELTEASNDPEPQAAGPHRIQASKAGFEEEGRCENADRGTAIEQWHRRIRPDGADQSPGSGN